MKLLLMPEGPMIRYWRDHPTTDGHHGENCWLEVDDLNPDNKIRFALSPWQLFKFGLKCLWAALIV